MRTARLETGEALDEGGVNQKLRRLSALCHEAAARLRSLSAENKRLRREAGQAKAEKAALAEQLQAQKAARSKLDRARTRLERLAQRLDRMGS